MTASGPARFSEIYASAIMGAGSEVALLKHLPRVRAPRELGQLPDGYFLSSMSRRIFRAGLKHAMVDAKWPAFEEVFHGFEPAAVMHMSDEDLERLMRDRRLIRHWGKLKSVRHNAGEMVRVAAEHGSFGRFIGVWPTADIVGLWLVLAKQFQQLGGASAGYFLRMVGRDTFLLTQDVRAALRHWGVAVAAGKGRDERARIQAAFNGWQTESARPLAAISVILARSWPG